MRSAIVLVGKQVSIRANDFVTKLSTGKIEAIDPARKAILITLDEPIDVGGTRYEWAVASGRLERDDLETFAAEGEMGCGITWIPSARFSHQDPFELNWWRGGGAAIADVLLR